MPEKKKKLEKESPASKSLEIITKTPEEEVSSEEEQAQKRMEQQLMDNARFMSILMIDGAMRFREVFWEEEVEANNKVTNVINKDLNKNKPNGWESMAKRNLIANEVFKSRQKRITEVLSNVIEDHTKNLSEEEVKQFEGFVIGIKIMIEEFLEAKNSTEIITLVKLYNQGLLDGIFEKFKKQNDENNSKNSNSIDGPDAVMQENNNTAEPAASIESGTP